MTRIQHIIPSALILIAGSFVLWVSYQHADYEAPAFLFPKLVMVVFVALAAWNLVTAFLKDHEPNEGFSSQEVLNLAPGVILAIAYIFWGAKALGFYTATTVFFFLLLSYYDPAPHGSLWSWAKRVIITACFIAVMYGLFALILNVYTPREIFS